jgi:hypothetical protein
MTETTRRALQIIKDNKLWLPKDFAWVMWPDNSCWESNSYRRRGGVYGAAGSLLGKLRRDGLIGGGLAARPYHLTPEGERLISS